MNFLDHTKLFDLKQVIRFGSSVDGIKQVDVENLKYMEHIIHHQIKSLLKKYPNYNACVFGGTVQFGDRHSSNTRSKLQPTIEVYLVPNSYYLSPSLDVRTGNQSSYNFSDLGIEWREADRDTLVKHVFQRQASQIREKNADNER